MSEIRSRAGVELRADDNGGDGYTLTGYASVFDTGYAVRDNLGEYTETIRAGAFTKALQERDDVRLLLNHDGVPLARTKSGTLTLEQDEIGLRCEARLDAASPLVASVKSAMDRGDMDQMSFAFQAVRQEWNADYSQRDIVEARLFDVSVVTYPASPTTSASLRQAADAVTDARGEALFSHAATELRSTGAVSDGLRGMLLELLGPVVADEPAPVDVPAPVESSRMRALRARALDISK